MEKKEKGKMGKIADFRSKSINPSKNNFLTSHQIFFFCGSPPKWTYMGELKIPSSGRVSRFAEFLHLLVGTWPAHRGASGEYRGGNFSRAVIF